MVTSRSHSFFGPRSAPLRGIVVILLLAGSFAIGCAPTEDPAAGERAASEPGAPDAEEARAAIRALLSEQVEAWNRGDVEAFMDGYARTDTLRFASGGGVRRGWQSTLDNYRKNYPNREAMGRLTFDQLKIDILSSQWAVAFGAWQLERTEDTPRGLFTLLLRNGNASRAVVADTDTMSTGTADAGANGATGWHIVYDHTSSARPPASD